MLDTTGAGLFDRKIIEQVRSIDDPYPYFRGLISEITSNIKLIKFDQPKRLTGKTKNNFYSLYDIGILGIIKHSKNSFKNYDFLRFFYQYDFYIYIFSFFYYVKYFFGTLLI